MTPTPSHSPDAATYVEASSSTLIGAARFIGDDCALVNAAFLKCKSADRDPAACLAQGKVATECAMATMKRIKATCDGPFSKYVRCLDKKGQRLDKCRTEQRAMEACVSGGDDE